MFRNKRVWAVIDLRGRSVARRGINEGYFENRAEMRRSALKAIESIFRSDIIAR